MTEFKSHLVKYSSPTKWDKAPYTTIWRIEGDADVILIQMSEDPENPNWVPMADIMVKAFDRFYHDTNFLNECIELYKKGLKSECHTIKFVR
jgi:hypothetical protein